MPISQKQFREALRTRKLSVIQQYVDEKGINQIEIDDLKYLLPEANASSSAASIEEELKENESSEDSEEEDKNGEEDESNEESQEDEEIKEEHEYSNEKMEEDSQSSERIQENSLSQEQNTSESQEQSQTNENEEDELTNTIEKAASVAKIIAYFINKKPVKNLIAKILIDLLLQDEISPKKFLILANDLNLEELANPVDNSDSIFDIEVLSGRGDQPLYLYTCYCLAEKITSSRLIRHDRTYRNIIKNLVTHLKEHADALTYLYYYALEKNNKNLLKMLLSKKIIVDFNIIIKDDGLNLFDFFMQNSSRALIKLLVSVSDQITQEQAEAIFLLFLKKNKRGSSEARSSTVKLLLAKKPEAAHYKIKQNPILCLAVSKLIDYIKEAERDICDIESISEVTFEEKEIFEIVWYLLKAGARVDQPNDKNKTAFELVKKVYKKLVANYKADMEEDGILLTNFYELFSLINQCDSLLAKWSSHYDKLSSNDRLLIQPKVFDEIWQLARKKIMVKNGYMEYRDNEEAEDEDSEDSEYCEDNESSRKNILHKKIVKELTDLINKQFEVIKKQSIIGSSLFKFVRILTKLSVTLRLKIEGSNPNELFSIKKPIHFFTYITNGESWIALPGDKPEKIPYQILTVLLEQAKRQPWEEGICLLMRQILQKISPDADYFSKTPSELYAELEIYEYKNGFHGINFSDDSDEDRIEGFAIQPLGQQVAINNYAEEMMQRGQVGNFFTKKGILQQFEKAQSNKHEEPNDEGKDSSLKKNKKLKNSSNKGEASGTKSIDKFFSKPKFTQQAEKNKSSKEEIEDDCEITNKTIKESKEKAVKKRKAVMNNISIYLRSTIHRNIPPSDFDKVVNALQLLNRLYTSGKLDEQTIKQIPVQFFIAQYRGVHYTTDTWDEETRRLHRKADESKQPSYSRAVYDMAKLDETKDSIHLTSYPEKLMKLKQSADLLEEQINYLRLMGSVICHKNAKSTYRYDSPLEAIQEFYTNDYAAYHRQLENIYLKKQKGKLIDDPLEVAFLFSQGKKTVTLSTGDTPYHPLRYAYGIKFYQPEKKEGVILSDKVENDWTSQEHSRLRPRWHEDGRAERPYSGKVYTYLFNPLNYLDIKPNHLVSMYNNAQVNVPYEIISERETTFWISIPQEKLIHQHVARYPNFHHAEYSEYFLSKYGLTQNMYEQYKEHILGNKPHTMENQLAKLLLGEHLCGFHEAQLVEGARLSAEKKKGYLIYRDIHGGFSLVLPQLYPTVPKAHSDKTSPEVQAAEYQRKEIEQKRAERENKPLEESSWINKLCNNYKVQTGINLAQVLSLLLKKSLAEIEEKLNQVNNQSLPNNPNENWCEKNINLILAQLELIAEAYVCGFTVKSVKWQQDKKININNDLDHQPVYQLVHLGGTGIFGLVPKTEPTLDNLKSHLFFKPQQLTIGENKTKGSINNNNNNKRPSPAKDEGSKKKQALTSSPLKS